MRRKTGNYTDEFKQNVVELTYARGSIVEICRDLDIPDLYWAGGERSWGNLVTIVFRAVTSQK